MDLINKSEYYIDNIFEEIELKELNKKIKNDQDKTTSGFVPTNLDFNNFVICLKNKSTDEIVAFLHFEIRKNFLDIPKYLFIIYSYTFINYRKKGLNRMLRLTLEEASKINNIDAIVSIPFPEAESRIVMNKLGYVNKKDDLFIKYIK